MCVFEEIVLTSLACGSRAKSVCARPIESRTKVSVPRARRVTNCSQDIGVDNRWEYMDLKFRNRNCWLELVSVVLL